MLGLISTPKDSPLAEALERPNFGDWDSGTQDSRTWDSGSRGRVETRGRDKQT